MSLRIQITLFAVVAIFCLFAALYVRSYVDPRPHGVILFVADGLNLEMLAAARNTKFPSGGKLRMETLGNTAFLRVSTQNYAMPDAAAAVSAISTGRRLPNGRVGMDEKEIRLDNLVYIAEKRGRSVGLVSNGDLTHPTAASFYAATSDLSNRSDIATQLVDNSGIDIIMGGGSEAFLRDTPVSGGIREDGRNLMKEAKSKGYWLAASASEMDEIDVWRLPKVLALFNEKDLFYRADLQKWFPGKSRPANQPRLADMVRRAIQFLEYHVSGYFLVVNANLIGRAAEQNEGRRAVQEVLELDDALKTATAYSGKKTLIVLASTGGIGGMTLTGSPTSATKKTSATPAQDALPVAWSSGPGGIPRDEKSRSWQQRKIKMGLEQNNPSDPDHRQEALEFSPSGYRAGGDVFVTGSGTGSSAIKGFLDGSAIFEIIKNQL